MPTLISLRPVSKHTAEPQPFLVSVDRPLMSVLPLVAPGDPTIITNSSIRPAKPVDSVAQVPKSTLAAPAVPAIQAPEPPATAPAVVAPAAPATTVVQAPAQPVVAPPAQPEPGDAGMAEVRRNAQGEPLVTNGFVDTDIRQAIADIAAQTGTIIIPDATVQGTVTAELRDVPLERALLMLLQSGGFAFAQQDGYYLIGAAEPSNPNFYLLSRTEVVKLKHLMPNAVLNLLALPYGRYLSTEGYVPPAPEPARNTSRTATGSRRITGISGTSDYRSQTIGSASVAYPPESYKVSITAPPYLIERIKADIARIDRPRTQVMLEAVVVEISQEALKDVGLNFATRWLQTNLASGGSNITYSEIANSEMVQLVALMQKGDARLRANPRVATAEGQTAELEVGRENYFSLTSGTVNFAYNTIEAIRSGILLRITPRIMEEENEIMARIEPEVRDVTGRTNNGLPEITFRRAATNLRVRNGQSIVIGGLINEYTNRRNTKIPILGDIPLIGRAFRGVSSRQIRTETVIIVTPRIMVDGAPMDGIMNPVLRQDLSNMRRGIAPLPFTPALEKKK